MKTALIIEDIPEHAFITSYFLQKSGYMTTTCHDPFRAISLVKTGQVTIVVTDLYMPEMNGLDLIRYIRQVNKTIPVIVISAYCCDENKVSALRSGANHFLCKPIDKELLHNIITNLN
jgi:CheY-like chemotaxis protein